MLVVAYGHIVKFGHTLAKKSVIMNLEDIGASKLREVDGSDWRLKLFGQIEYKR